MTNSICYILYQTCNGCKLSCRIQRHDDEILWPNMRLHIPIKFSRKKSTILQILLLIMTIIHSNRFIIFIEYIKFLVYRFYIDEFRENSYKSQINITMKNKTNKNMIIILSDVSYEECENLHRLPVVLVFLTSCQKVVKKKSANDLIYMMYVYVFGIIIFILSFKYSQSLPSLFTLLYNNGMLWNILVFNFLFDQQIHRYRYKSIKIFIFL